MDPTRPARQRPTPWTPSTGSVSSTCSSAPRAGGWMSSAAPCPACGGRPATTPPGPGTRCPPPPRAACRRHKGCSARSPRCRPSSSSSWWPRPRPGAWTTNGPTSGGTPRLRRGSRAPPNPLTRGRSCTAPSSPTRASGWRSSAATPPSRWGPRSSSTCCCGCRGGAWRSSARTPPLHCCPTAAETPP